MSMRHLEQSVYWYLFCLEMLHFLFWIRFFLLSLLKRIKKRGRRLRFLYSDKFLIEKLDFCPQAFGGLAERRFLRVAT